MIDVNLNRETGCMEQTALILGGEDWEVRYVLKPKTEVVTSGRKPTFEEFLFAASSQMLLYPAWALYIATYGQD